MDIRSTHPINLLANGRYKVPVAMDREKRKKKKRDKHRNTTSGRRHVQQMGNKLVNESDVKKMIAYDRYRGGIRRAT